MIIKEKRWLSRFVAMLCVLTMVVGVLTPASVRVAAAGGNSSVEKIVFSVNEDLKYYYYYGGSLENLIDDVKNSEYLDNGYLTTDLGWKCKLNNNNIEIYPEEGSYFKVSPRVNIAEFYVSGNVNATSKNTGIDVRKEYDAGKTKVGIRILDTATDNNVNIDIEPQYTLTFSEGEGYEVSNISCESGKASINKIESSATATKDTEIKFEVKLLGDNNEGKEVSAVLYGVPLMGKTEDNTTYSFTATVGSRNATVLISVVDKTFTIDDSDYYNIDKKGFTYIRNTDNNQVNYGKNFSFSVYPAEGYTDPKVTIDNDGHGSLKQNGTVYNITNITGNQKINIESGESEKYEVHFSTGIGYTVEGDGQTNIDEDGVVRNVDYGGTVNFKIVLDNSAAYKIVSVTSGGKTVPSENNNIYTLSNIKDNTTVNIVVQKQMFDVKFVHKNSNDNGTKYTVSGTEGKFEYGTLYSFWVTPSDGYDAPTVTIDGDENPLKPASGTQYVINIEKNTSINIVAPDNRIQRKIILNPGTGFSYKAINDSDIKDQPTIYDNDDYEFKVNLDSGYDRSKNSIIVTANNITISPNSEGIYTINNVKEDQVVTVSGVQKNVYDVTLKDGDGYTIDATENTKVSHGEKFRFKVKLKDGYKYKNDIKAEIQTDDNTVVEGPDINDYYSITVTNDITIEVTNVELETFEAELNEDSLHASLTNKSDGTLNAIDYNGILEFKVKADDYYHTVQVSVDGIIVEPVNDIYTVKKITSTPVVRVQTAPNILTVNYIDEKYNKSKTVEYSVEYVGEYGNVSKDGDVTLYTPVDTDLYKFAGWLKDDDSTAENIKINNTKDTALTVTADWKLNTESIKGKMPLSTKGSWKEVNGQYRYKLSVKTILELEEELSDEFKKEVKVEAYGTFYSNHSMTNDFDDTARETSINKRNGRADKEGMLCKEAVSGQENVYNYYADVTLTIDDLSTKQYFSLNLDANSTGERYVIGWLKLAIGNESFILYADEVYISNEATE